MMMKYGYILLFIIAGFTACKKSKQADPSNLPAYYFPPLKGDEWAKAPAASIGWDEDELAAAFEFAESKHTRGMIVIHQGKIVREQYWSNWTSQTKTMVASAGKSVLAFVVGLAEQEGLLDINQKTSFFLGPGWTSLSKEKENMITLKHQLSMTTGLNDLIADTDCQDPTCLQYKADAGSRWAYHNAPYRLLQKVVANASGQTWNSYCASRLFEKIGLDGQWINHILYCTTRDAARFGSLILNKGSWAGHSLLNTQSYFNAMLNSSQDMNRSYGYLWWLNGKTGFMLPSSQGVFRNALIPHAPDDMIMAFGKDDQKIYVLPGQNVVVVRLGNNTGMAVAGPGSFDYELWFYLKKAMNY